MLDGRGCLALGERALKTGRYFVGKRQLTAVLSEFVSK
jgi:hypothetical protein